MWDCSHFSDIFVSIFFFFGVNTQKGPWQIPSWFLSALESWLMALSVRKTVATLAPCYSSLGPCTDHRCEFVLTLGKLFLPESFCSIWPKSHSSLPPCWFPIPLSTDSLVRIYFCCPWMWELILVAHLSRMCASGDWLRRLGPKWHLGFLFALFWVTGSGRRRLPSCNNAQA